MPSHSLSRCDGPRHSRVWRPTLVIGAAMVLAATASAGDFSIEASAISAGGGQIRSAGGCLTIDASVGQEIAGMSEGGPFSMRSGFWPAVGDRPTDSLFNNGFEECL